MNNQSGKSVKWYEVNNIIPIISSFVAVAVSFGALMVRISVLETKVDSLITLTEKQNEKYTSIENRYGDLSLKIKEVETILSLRK